MTTGKALDGKPYAGNPRVRFDEGEVASCTAEASLRRVHCRRQPEAMTRPQVASRSEVDRGLRASVCAATPRRGSLLYKKNVLLSMAVASAAAALVFGGVASVGAAPDVQTGKVAVRPFEYGDRVAFYGDSITRNGEAITRMAAYYRRAFPGRNVRFFNVGISGGTVSAAHFFFDKYLVPLRPTHVVLAFGVNDAGAVIADDAVARFESEYERLIERIQDIDAAVVLRTPTSFGVVSSNRSAAHGRIADSVRRIAEKRVLPLLDDHALFGERIAAGENLFIGDNVHPNERGQWCLSEDFLAAQGLDAGAFRPFVEVASESGLAAWHDAAVALTYIPATEWLVMHGEELSLDEKLAKARKWLDDNEGKDGVNPAMLRFVREYLRIKPHEAEFRSRP